MFSLGYIIESQICIAVLYLLYMGLLHRRVSHSIARAYLIMMIPLGLVIPLVSLPLLPAEPVTTQIMFSDIDLSAYTVMPEVEPQASPVNYLLIFYLAGATIMMLWMIIGATRLFRLLRKSQPEHIEGLKVVFAQQKISAYSVFDYIFINIALRRSEFLHELLAHEECHIRLHHTVDLIFMSLARIAMWFNPAVWHTGSLMRQVHEFQVDAKVLDQGYSAKNYINLLIMSEAGVSPELASPLSYSLTKKRLKMLSQKQNAGRLRLMLTIPAVALLMGTFSLTTRAAEETTALTEITKEPAEQVEFTTDSLKIRIHGIKTDSDIKPLILINGEEFTGEIEDLNPNTIHSISVLKDGSSTKTYGTKGENGVIFITTKGSIEETDQQTAGKPVSITVHKIGNISDQDNSAIIVGYQSKGEMPKDILYVVDGKEYNGNIEDLDPQGIESINVIKGNDATEKYGEKAKVGVVEITTKEAISRIDQQTAGKPVSITVHKIGNTSDQNNSAIIVGYQSEEKLPKDIVYIVDGKEYNGNIEDLDPQGIESINVIKGNDATEKYGEKAKNGVIIINTKGTQEPTTTGQIRDVKFINSNDSNDSTKPMIIIDGNEFKGEMSSLNPDNIENISVLKGNSGTEIYGEKAKDGVIIITTKDNTASTQKENRSAQNKKDQPVVLADEMPEFQGSKDLNIFRMWISENVSYPQKSAKDGIEGNVVAKFVVEKDGSVNEVAIARSVSKEIDDETIKVVKSSPRWKPGSIKGEPVRVTLMVTVKFTLPKEGK